MISVSDPDKKVLYWGFRALIVIVPTLITSFFSYRTALVQATDSSAHTAEAGYQEHNLVFEKIQEELQRQSLAIARLEGEMEMLQQMNEKAEMIPAPYESPAQQEKEMKKAKKGGKKKAGQVIQLGEINVGAGGGAAGAPAASPQPSPALEKPAAVYQPVAIPQNLEAAMAAIGKTSTPSPAPPPSKAADAAPAKVNLP